MSAKVTFKITKSDGFRVSEPFNPPYVAGQITFVEDTGGIYVDFHGQRKQYGKTTSGINYIGIALEDPSKIPPPGTVEIKDIGSYTPSNNDMVVYNSKEYLWRVGQNGAYGWFEVGDEESPEWHKDESIAWDED